MKIGFKPCRIAEEIARVPESERAGVKDIIYNRIQTLCNKQAPSQYRFRLMSLNGDALTRLYVADDRFSLWVAGHDSHQTILGGNRYIADTLTEICDKVGGDEIIDADKTIERIDRCVEARALKPATVADSHPRACPFDSGDVKILLQHSPLERTSAGVR